MTRIQRVPSRRSLPRAFLLDFDGVVVDSAELKTAAFAEIYQDEAPEKVSQVVAYQRHHGGVSRRLKFEHFEKSVFGRQVGPSAIDALCQRYSDMVLAKVIAAPLLPGALGFLEAAGRVADLFLISGTPRQELCHILAERGLTGYFRSVHGAPQSKPAAFEAILASGGFAPEQTVAIGDAITECEAALALGIPFIGIRPPGHDAGFPAAVEQVDSLSDVAQIFALRA